MVVRIHPPELHHPRNVRAGAIPLLLAAALAFAPAGAVAQKRCVRGKPCGATCIARDRTCRIGPGGAAAGDSSAGEAPARGNGAALPVCAVTRVIDGDTVECATGERVRLLLIDAPERDQAPYGPRATRALAALLPPGTAARVELDLQERDRYGRILAYLYLPDGRMANEELLRQGFAVVAVHPPNVKHVERMRAAAQEAREAGRGLWATPAFLCLPADHRAGRCE